MTTLQITAPPTEIDWRLASECIFPLHGVTVVEMDSPPEMFRGLYIPSDLEQDLWPDTGTVLASNGTALKPGDRVLCHPEDGKWLEEAQFGPYKAKNRVRMFGWAGDSPDAMQRIPWDESILAVMEGMKIKSLGGRNVLIRRDPVIQEQGGILLDSESTYRSQMATVEMIGDGARDVKQGDRVVYWSGARLDFYDESDPDLAMIREEHILAVVGN